MILTRPWFAGETCTAKENSTNIIPQELNDYVVPTDERLANLDEIWSQQQKNHLLSFACTKNQECLQVYDWAATSL